PASGATTDKFYGAINLPDGRALFIPYSKGNVGIFDPSTNAYADGAAVNAGSARYRGGCLHPETGLIVMAPLLSPHIGLYDTRNHQFRAGANVGASPGYHGAVVSSVTGKVILVPGTG